MAAVAHKAAADEHNVTHGIDAAQFPNGIKQKDRKLRPRSFHFLQFGTEAHLIAKFGVHLFDLFNPVELTGSNNQAGTGIFFAHGGKRSQHSFLFRTMSGTCHNDRIGIFPQSQFCFIGCQIFRGNLCVGLVKFRVAGHNYFFRIRAQLGNIFGINAGLHAEEADGVQHITQEAGQIPVTFCGFFRDAAIHHHRGDVPLPDGPQEVRP